MNAVKNLVKEHKMKRIIIALAIAASWVGTSFGQGWTYDETLTSDGLERVSLNMVSSAASFKIMCVPNKPAVVFFAQQTHVNLGDAKLKKQDSMIYLIEKDTKNDEMYNINFLSADTSVYAEPGGTNEVHLLSTVNRKIALDIIKRTQEITESNRLTVAMYIADLRLGLTMNVNNFRENSMKFIKKCNL